MQEPAQQIANIDNLTISKLMVREISVIFHYVILYTNKPSLFTRGIPNSLKIHRYLYQLPQMFPMVTYSYGLN